MRAAVLNSTPCGRLIRTALSRWPILAGLAIACVAIGLVWFVSYSAARTRAQRQHDEEVKTAAHTLQRQIKQIESVLYSARGLIAASRSVEGHEWRAFTEELRQNESLDGALGLGLVMRVRAEDADAFVESRRSSGQPDFAIRRREGATASDELLPIVFLEPIERMGAGIGFDVASAPESRLTVWEAVRDDRIAATSALHLAAPGPGAVGSVMYLPVYAKGARIDTREERSEAVVAWIGAPLSPDTLLANAFEGRTDDCVVELLDEDDDGKVLAGLRGATPCQANAVSDAWTSEALVRVGSRVWIVRARRVPPLISELASETLAPTGMGVALGVLMVALVASMSGTRARAMALAQRLSSEHRRGEALLRETARLVQVGSWEFDLATSRITWSDEVRRIHEVDEDYVPRIDTAIAFYEGGAAEAIQAAIERAVQDGAPWDLELPFRTAKGNARWVRAVGRADRTDGVTHRLWGTFQDITAARSTLAMAEAASRAKGEFLANMSHEIRTPMTAILGYAELLESDESVSSDPALTAEAVGTIRANAHHLLTIINDVLDMSKIEAGRMSVERLATSPHTIVEEAAALLRPQAVGKGLRLDVRYETDTPARVMTDPTRLRQILLNLAGNAIKFTEVGAVTIVVSCDASAERMRFAVIDTGIGMTPEQRDSIARFEAFHQADGSMTRTYGGTGLGLGISNCLSEMLGGSIRVDSERGRGSRFELEIDTGPIGGGAMITPREAMDGGSGACDATDAGLDDGASECRGALGGVRVLLAEDGPDNQRLISFYLRKAGADVTIADNGLVAVETMRRVPRGTFDLILMDMQMPELDGYEAADRLRTLGHDEPIVALTAHAMRGDRERCLGAGCDEYITKPIARSALIALCRGVIDARESGASRAA